jgi:hypothetical protein
MKNLDVHELFTAQSMGRSISGAPFLHQSPSYLQLKGRHLAENYP